MKIEFLISTNFVILYLNITLNENLMTELEQIQIN